MIKKTEEENRERREVSKTWADSYTEVQKYGRIPT